jgi:hypothetical protein
VTNPFLAQTPNYLLPSSFSSLIRDETGALFGRKKVSFVSRYQSKCLPIELIQKKGSYVNFFRIHFDDEMLKRKQYASGGRLFSYWRWMFAPVVDLVL